MSGDLLTPRDILAQRLACDAELLARLDAHASRLRAAREGAAAALAAAQARLEALDAEISSIDARVTPLRASVAELRDRMRPCLPDRLPAELLRAVFLQLAPGDADFDEPDEGLSPKEIDRDRLRWPFALAAVCQRWRALALLTPLLWTYVAVPQHPQSQAPRFRYLVDILLERSGQATIDIFLPWTTRLWVEATDAPVLNAIAKESNRWRRMHLSYYAQHLPMSISLMLRRPTPCLREFCVRFSPYNYAWPTQHPPILTLCPNLRRLYWENTPVLPAGSPGAVVQLQLKVHLASAALWAYLRACPRLQALQLEFVAAPADAGAMHDAPLSLVRLARLGVCQHAARMFAANAQNVLCPALRRVDVRSDDLPHLAPFLETVREHLDTLNVAALVDHAPERVEGLRPLAALRRLCVGFRDDVQTHYAPDFVSALTGGVLPALETVCVHGKLTDEAGDALVALVSERSVSDSEDHVAGVRSIREVVFGKHGHGECQAPEWVVAQINARLGEASLPPAAV